jgi:hypothetical protein
MQSKDEEAKKTHALDNQIEQEPELSEAWRTLLGIQPTDMQVQAAGHQGVTEEQEGLPLQTNDPWNQLSQTQGVQAVDLQQVRLLAAPEPMSEMDLEQALDMMREQPIQGANEG